MLTRGQLQRAASDTGFPIDSLEKVSMLVRLLNLMAAHPFLGPRVALKGGTALNLFVFELPRLSVDVDVNYIGAADRETMMADRTKLDAALAQVAGRLGLTVKRAPGEHAGASGGSRTLLRSGARRSSRSTSTTCSVSRSGTRRRRIPRSSWVTARSASTC